MVLYLLFDGIVFFLRVFFVNLDFWCIFVPSSIEVAKFMASSFHLSSSISMKSFFLRAKEEYMVDMDCMCFSWLFFFYAGSFMLIFVYLFC